MAHVPPRSVSRTYPALRAKKLSWADQMDHMERMQAICAQESITLEEFARLLHYMLPRCELDTTKTSHHFQIEDTFVDLMYRDHVVISLSRKPAPDVIEEAEEEVEEQEPVTDDPYDTHDTLDTDNTEEEDEDEDEEKETVPETKPTETVAVVQNTTDTTKADLCSAEPAQDDVPAPLEGEAGWTRVESEHEKRLRRLRTTPTTRPLTKHTVAEADSRTAVSVKALSNQWSRVVTHPSSSSSLSPPLAPVPEGAHKPFYFFCNEANASFMDFVQKVQGLDALKTAAKAYRWAHGYQMDDHLVYDFHDPQHPGVFRRFVPNSAYMQRFQRWLDEFVAHHERVPEDTRRFYVFRENSTWPKWTVLGTHTGLAAVRQAVLCGGSEYGHAYCVDTNDLVNFWLNEGHFRQQATKAPQKYLSRFETYFHHTETNAPDTDEAAQATG